MRVAILGLLSLVLLCACSTVQPTSPGSPLPPTPSPADLATPSASPPGEVTETRGGVTFTRPASWFGVQPPEALVPGPYWWLSSEPLSATCPMVPGFPLECLPGGLLRDGGILITFSSGATLILSAPTPLPLETLASDACTRAGGQAVATGVGGTYIEACLRGQPAEAAFDRFFRSLIESTK